MKNDVAIGFESHEERHKNEKAPQGVYTDLSQLSELERMSVVISLSTSVNNL